MSESKDIRKRKFHCEKEDMLNKQKSAMKLKPIGSKSGNASDDPGSESDTGSDKDDVLNFDYSDFEEESKPATNAEMTEEISSEEEDILTEPQKTDAKKSVSPVPVENLESISSDENDEVERKQSIKGDGSDEHVENISSDEETINSEVKSDIKSESLNEKKSNNDENLDAFMVTDEAVSDIENISSVDEKEEKLEKSMEAISSDEQEEFKDLKIKSENDRDDNINVKSECDIDSDISNKSNKEDTPELITKIKEEKVDDDDLLLEKLKTEDDPEADINLFDIKKDCSDDIEEEEKLGKNLDTISSDEETWNDPNHKNTNLSKTIKEEPKDKVIPDIITHDIKEESDIKKEKSAQDTVSISSEEPECSTEKSENSSTKNPLKTEVKKTKSPEVISSDENVMFSDTDDNDGTDLDFAFNEQIGNSDGRYEFDFNFFMKDPDYDDEGKCKNPCSEADILRHLTEIYESQSNKCIQKVRYNLVYE